MTRATVVRDNGSIELDENGHIVKQNGTIPGDLVKEVLRFRDETESGGDGFVQIKNEPIPE